MLQAIGGMFAQQQHQNQHLFQQWLQAVGNGSRAGVRTQGGALGKAFFHRAKESNWNGRKFRSSLFRCAIKHASTDNYRILNGHRDGHPTGGSQP